MNARGRFPILDSLITVLLVLLVFFVSYLFDGPYIFGIIMTTAFFYAFYYYYRKSKALQRQLASFSQANPGAPRAAPENGVPPPLD